MSELWSLGDEPGLDKEMNRFTVGEDYILDAELIEADVLGSIAHAKMLSTIGILSDDEFAKLRRVLAKIPPAAKQGKFVIRQQDEDVHTAVENHVTKKLGDLGKKIHTGRSRNDQIIVDTRIYTRDRLLDIQEEVLRTAALLTELAGKYKKLPMPGRTHTQLAMPSSVGLWMSAFAESLMDDLKLVRTAAELNNQCPLGSAASYGVALPLDRQLTSDLLGFAKVQNNVLYANNSRGKIEAVVIFALAEIMQDLAKLSNDLILFSIPELGYFTLPEKYCPGSSIMPQKRNPGPLELTRAKANAVEACLHQIMGITRTLPSGYNRDLQETKGPLMRALGITESCLRVIRLVFKHLKVNKKRLVDSFAPELFAADEAIEMAKKGIPFRTAYREIKKKLKTLKTKDPVANITSKTHLGAPGNLGLDKLRVTIGESMGKVDGERKRLAKVRKDLLSL
ncbi:MAG: argininosuccinate lyase [Planctomycetes bacterium]|nr:argininosuccinate lyase [Planctomycetota bacterium]